MPVRNVILFLQDLIRSFFNIIVALLTSLPILFKRITVGIFDTIINSIKGIFEFILAQINDILDYFKGINTIDFIAIGILVIFLIFPIYFL